MLPLSKKLAGPAQALCEKLSKRFIGRLRRQPAPSASATAARTKSARRCASPYDFDTRDRRLRDRARPRYDGAGAHPDRGAGGVHRRPHRLLRRKQKNRAIRIQERVRCGSMENNKRPETMARITTEALAAQFIDEQVREIRAQVGDKRVLLALSGGVDSLGRRGAADQGRRQAARSACTSTTGCCARASRSRWSRCSAIRWARIWCMWTQSERFLDKLAGVADPEAEAQNHRRRVHPRVRGGGPQAVGHRVPRTGHHLPRHRGKRHQDRKMVKPPQRRRSAGGPAASSWWSRCKLLFKDEVRVVRRSAGPAGRHGLPPALPRPGSGRALPGRHHPRPAGGRARGGRHPARGICRSTAWQDKVWQYFTVVPDFKSRRRAGRRPQLCTTRSSCARSTPSTR